tara:strand:- start:6039 stop:6542 length:504 start_codon:yes stop_codon:yes gene_type:complete
MSNKNVAVFFGDENFPKKGRGNSSKKWTKAVNKLATVLHDLQIHYAYLPSYKGANVVAGHVLDKLDIPYTLVIPHPSFGSNSTMKSKIVLADLSEKANKTVVLGEEQDPDAIKYNSEEITSDFVDYISKHCNSIVIASKKGAMTEKLEKLLRQFPEEAFKKIYTVHY